MVCFADTKPWNRVFCNLSRTKNIVTENSDNSLRVLESVINKIQISFPLIVIYILDVVWKVILILHFCFYIALHFESTVIFGFFKENQYWTSSWYEII